MSDKPDVAKLRISERLERVRRKNAESLGKEFAHDFGPSDVCHADIRWLCERLAEALGVKVNELR